MLKCSRYILLNFDTLFYDPSQTDTVSLFCRQTPLNVSWSTEYLNSTPLQNFLECSTEFYPLLLVVERSFPTTRLFTPPTNSSATSRSLEQSSTDYVLLHLLFCILFNLIPKQFPFYVCPGRNYLCFCVLFPESDVFHFFPNPPMCTYIVEVETRFSFCSV